MEKCCGIFVAPILFKKGSRFILLFFYLILIILASIAASQLSVYFSQMFFVSDDSPIAIWFEKHNAYFEMDGETTATYVENSGIDFSDIEV